MDPQEKARVLQQLGGAPGAVSMPGMTPAPQEELSFVEEWGPAAVRMAAPVLGFALSGGNPFGGFAGGAAGETIAQMWERSQGRREELNAPMIAGSAVLGGMPIGRGASLLGTVGREALTGAGAASLQPVLEEGRAPSVGELALGAGLGAVAGKVVQRTNIRRAREAEEALEATDAATRASQQQTDVPGAPLSPDNMPDWINYGQTPSRTNQPTFDPTGGLDPQGYTVLQDEIARLKWRTGPDGAEIRFQTPAAARDYAARNIESPEGKAILQTLNRAEREAPYLMDTWGKPGMDAPGIHVGGRQLRESRFMDWVVRNVAQGAVEQIDKVAEIYLNSPGGTSAQVGKIVGGMLARGEIDGKDFMNSMHRSGWTIDDFASAMFRGEWTKDLGSSARHMGRHSYIKRRMNLLLEERRLRAKAEPANPEIIANYNRLKQSMASADNPDTMWDFFIHGGSWDVMMPGRAGRVVGNVLPNFPGYKRIDETRRKLLVAQTKTFSRNVITQQGRFSFGVMDESFQDVLGSILPGFIGPRERTGNGVALLTSWLQMFRKKTRNEMTEFVNEILTEFPKAAIKLFRHPVGEASVGRGFTDIITIPNQTQEIMFRRMTFAGYIKAGLKRSGVGYGTAMRDPRKYITKELIDQAVDKSLDVTFAADPKVGFGKAIMDAYQAMPLLTAINPFPRFMSNAWKFLMEFNPLAAIRLVGVRADDVVGAARRAEILSRATIGTGMWAMAMAVDRSELRGDKWYQIKVEADEGTQIFDARGYAPFAQALFYARIARGFIEGMTEDEYENARNGYYDPNRNAFDRALANINMNWKDFIQGTLNVNRIAGPGRSILDIETTEGAMRTAGRIVGEYAGGFTVPFRTVKDFYGGLFDADELIHRETRTRDPAALIAGPLVQNIPGISQFLPGRPSPTEAGLRRAETPIISQLVGLSRFSPTELDQEISRLRIPRNVLYPKQSNPEAYRLITQRQGQLLERMGLQLITNPFYQRAQPVVQRLMLEERIFQVRRTATRMIKAEYPALAVQLAKESMSGKEKRYLDTDLPPQNEPLDPQRALRREMELDELDLFRELGG